MLCFPDQFLIPVFSCIETLLIFPDSPEMQSPTCEACIFALYVVNVKLHSVLFLLTHRAETALTYSCIYTTSTE